MPPAPIGGRHEPAAAAFGGTFAIWGGTKGRPHRTALPDGALFSTTAWRWEVLSAAPLEPRKRASLVWNRDRLFVWGGFVDWEPLDPAGEPPVFADGAEYQPRSRTWRPLPASPLAPRANHVAFEVRDGFAVWGGDEMYWRPKRRPRAFSDGARYDSRLNTWTPLAPCPLPLRHFRRSLWTGQHLLVWNGSKAPEESTGRRPAEDGLADVPVKSRPDVALGDPGVAAYEPEDDRWTILPAPPQAAERSRSVWIEGRMILLGLDGSTTIWDVFSGASEAAPRSPIHPDALAQPTSSLDRLADAAIALVPEQDDGRAVLHAWLYGPPGARWLDGGLAPIAPRFDAVIAAGPNHLFVWGGVEPGSRSGDPLVDGFVLTSGARAAV